MMHANAAITLLEKTPKKIQALIAQLGDQCTGKAKVVGSIPVQSLKIFSDLFFQKCYGCVHMYHHDYINVTVFS